MFITVTVAEEETDVVFRLEVPDHLTVADFKVMCQREIWVNCIVEKGAAKTIPASEMVLIADIRMFKYHFGGREGRPFSVQIHASFTVALVF